MYDIFSPFRLCSFCAFDFPFRGNFFGSFASWVFFFFFFPPFRWAGEEGGSQGAPSVFYEVLPPLPLDFGPARGAGVLLGICLSRAGSLLLLLLREVGARGWLSCCRRPFPASPSLLTLLNSHRTFHDVRIRGSLQSLAPAFYPPASHALRSVARGWIRGLGHVRLALVDVAVALALAPLTVRG